MRITAIFIVLVMVASSLSGCTADDACEKVVELDNAGGRWDDAFLIVAERVGASTGHFEVVAIVKIAQGVKTVCAAKDCVGMADVDACASLASSYVAPDAETSMLIGMVWDSERQIGDEVESTDMEESRQTEWGEWDLSNPVFF